jgi:hypothetical protein
MSELNLTQRLFVFVIGYVVVLLLYQVWASSLSCISISQKKDSAVSFYMHPHSSPQCSTLAYTQALKLNAGSFELSESPPGIDPPGPWATWHPFDDSLLLPDSTPSEPVHILVFGDSLDRFMVDDGCKAWAHTKVKDFTRKVLKYKENVHPSRICWTQWGSLSFLHLYGSRPRGPYYMGHQNSPEDPFTDTELRIPKAMELYLEAVKSRPTFIMFQSNLWDSRLLTDEASVSIAARMAIVRRYMTDLNNTLQTLMHRNTTILMRTTPVAYAFPHLVADFNAGLRLVAASRSIGLVDWDAMLSGLNRQPNQYSQAPVPTFRDDHHPTVQFSRQFAFTLTQFCRGLQRQLRQHQCLT